MAAIKRSRLAAIAAASVGLHAAVFAYLALDRPALASRNVSEQVFDVTLVPLYLIEPEHSRPTPIRPRPARLSLTQSPIVPLRLPPVAASPTPIAPQASPASSAETTPDLAALGRALRSGGVGCRNQDMSGLSQEERAHCLERLGVGARNAPFYRPGIDPRKQANFDAWGEKKSLQWKRDHEQITGFGHITTDGGPTMRTIPDTNPTPKGPNEIRIPF